MSLSLFWIKIKHVILIALSDLNRRFHSLIQEGNLEAIISGAKSTAEDVLGSSQRVYFEPGSHGSAVAACLDLLYHDKVRMDIYSRSFRC